tara:strand:- start:778 stop:1611 length:834 start_codon:yes stop_codon:yes gene_type:complete
MVDEVTIEDLKPKEDKFTLSDFFTDDDDVVTDLGDDISLQDISSEDPQGFFGGLGATGVDLLRDYRNTLAATGEGISTFMPVGNYFLPEMFKNMMYEDPEGDVLFPLQDNALDIARDVGNYIYPPSEVDEDNPYKDMFRNIRLAGNVIPALVGTVGSRGQVGLPFLMKHLNPTIQKTISQLLPKMSGQGKFFSKNFFREPNTMRNVVLSQMTNPDLIRDSMTAEAAPINTGIQDRNYAVFDDYMQDRMSNLKNQRTADQGPRQPSNRQPGLDDYRGL